MPAPDLWTPALIGSATTLAGVLLTGVIAWRIDVGRRRHEEARRWDERRRTTYQDFVDATWTLFRALRTTALVRQSFAGSLRPTLLELPRHLRPVQRVAATVAATRFDLQLLGSPPVIAAADAIGEIIDEAAAFARVRHRRDETERAFDEWQIELRDLVREFMAASRVELGIPGEVGHR